MSNVLIGIIGVILFIGLALAGALFLGPRFQEATNNSKASAAVQSVTQVARAVNLYTVQEGREYGSVFIDDLRTAGYLKGTPSNPVYPTYNVILSDDAGSTTISRADYAIMGLSPPGENAVLTDAVCLAIAKQTGQVASTASAVPTGPRPPVGVTAGCIRLTQDYNYAGANQRMVFARI